MIKQLTTRRNLAYTQMYRKEGDCGVGGIHFVRIDLQKDKM